MNVRTRRPAGPMKRCVIRRTLLCTAVLLLQAESAGAAAAADPVAEAAYGNWLIRPTGVAPVGAMALDVPSVRPAVRQTIVDSAVAAVIPPGEPAAPLPLQGVDSQPLYGVAPAPLLDVGPAPLFPVGTLPLLEVASTPLLPVEPQLPSGIDPQQPADVETPVGAAAPLDGAAPVAELAIDPIVGFPLAGSPAATLPVTTPDRIEGPETIRIDGVMAKCEDMAPALRRRFASCDQPLVPSVVPRTPATSAPPEPEVAAAPTTPTYQPGTIELVPDAPAPAAGEATVIVNGRPVSCSLLPEALRARMASCRLGAGP